MQLITTELVTLDLAAETKTEVIEALAQRMAAANRLYDVREYVEAVEAREETFSTALGFDVAIPHGKTDAVKDAALAFARLKKDIMWSEDESARYVFMIAVPSAAAGDYHLKVLASLSRQLMHDDFRERLCTIQEPEEIVALIGKLTDD